MPIVISTRDAVAEIAGRAYASAGATARSQRFFASAAKEDRNSGLVPVAAETRLIKESCGRMVGGVVARKAAAPSSRRRDIVASKWPWIDAVVARSEERFVHQVRVDHPLPLPGDHTGQGYKTRLPILMNGGPFFV